MMTTGMIPEYADSTEQCKSKSPNILILSLSTFQGKPLEEDKSKLVLTQSHLTNENVGKRSGWDRTYYYQMEPIPYQLIDDLENKGRRLDQIIIVCTSDVRRKRDIIVDNIEYQNVSPLDYFKWKIEEYISKRATYKEKKIIFRAFGEINTSEPDTQKELDETIHVVTDVLNCIRDLKRKSSKDLTVYMDTHGGLRTIQSIMNGLLSLLQLEEIQTGNVYHIIYDGATKSGTIVSGDGAVQIIDFAAGINECINYGRTKSLIQFYENRGVNPPEAVTYMTKVAESIQLNDVDQFEEELRNLREQMECLDDVFLKSFSEAIRTSYGNILSEGHTVIDEAEWCLEKGFFMQALTLIESKMPKLLIDCGIISSTDCFIPNTTELKPECEADIITEKEEKMQNWKNVHNYLFDKFCKIWYKNTARNSFSLWFNGNLYHVSRDDATDQREQISRKILTLHRELKDERNVACHPKDNCTRMDCGKLKDMIAEYLNKASDYYILTHPNT